MHCVSKMVEQIYLFHILQLYNASENILGLSSSKFMSCRMPKMITSWHLPFPACFKTCMLSSIKIQCRRTTWQRCIRMVGTISKNQDELITVIFFLCGGWFSWGLWKHEETTSSKSRPKAFHSLRWHCQRFTINENLIWFFPFIDFPLIVNTWQCSRT